MNIRPIQSMCENVTPRRYALILGISLLYLVYLSRSPQLIISWHEVSEPIPMLFTATVSKKFIYNKIPKTGSTTMTRLMKLWSAHKGINIFTTGFSQKHLDETKKKEVARRVYSKRANVPYMYLRHFHFFNMSRYARAENPPIFFSIIRDPLSRFNSYYYYIRRNVKFKAIYRKNIAHERERKYDSFSEYRDEDINVCVKRKSRGDCTLDRHHRDITLTLPYFCGHASFCMTFNSSEALRIAKRHIEEYYPLVGLTEHFNETILLMEKIFDGALFEGFTDFAYAAMDRGKIVDYPKLDMESKGILKSYYEKDYELYQFAEQRFFRQLSLFK